MRALHRQVPAGTSLGEREVDMSVAEVLAKALLVEEKWNRKDLGSLASTVEQFVEDRGVVIQAGGCLGIFAEWLAPRFDAVYVFEPDPELFRVTVQRVRNWMNVVPINAALGYDRHCVRTVCELRGGKTVLHSGMTRTESGGIIPTLRIDDLALPDCNLVYLDIEGDEYEALRGAIQTIKRCRPVIAMEINQCLAYRGISADDLRTRLRLLGYAPVAKFRSDEVFMMASEMPRSRLEVNDDGES